MRRVVFAIWLAASVSGCELGLKFDDVPLPVQDASQAGADASTLLADGALATPPDGAVEPDDAAVPPDAGEPADAAAIPPDAGEPADAAAVPPDAAEPADAAAIPPDAAEPADAAAIPPDAAVPADAAAIPPDAAEPADADAVPPDAAEPADADAIPPDAAAPDASSAFTDCDGGLYDLQTDPAHCGTCDYVCTLGSSAYNASPACASGICGLTCDADFADCNTSSDDGCEVYLWGDRTNCGACGHVCGTTNSVTTCPSGKCIFGCVADTAHCSSDDSLGCETLLLTDANNCGSCGFGCGTASTCDNGLCKYTSGSEAIGQMGGWPLVADTTTLYWANVSSSTNILRAVGKDGAASPRDVRATANGPHHSSLSVDSSFIYYFFDEWGTYPYRQIKSGGQEPSALSAGGFIGGTGMAIYTDGDSTHAATSYFIAQQYNSSGFYRALIGSSPPPELVFATSQPLGFARVGNLIYFANADDPFIRYFDNSASPLLVQSLQSLPAFARSLTTDGSYLYAIGSDSNLYKLDLLGGAPTKIASVGTYSMPAAPMATDGSNVYIAASSALYKVSVNDTGASFNTRVLVPNTSIGNIIGVALDANAVYFATETNVYKTRK